MTRIWNEIESSVIGGPGKVIRVATDEDGWEGIVLLEGQFAGHTMTFQGRKHGVVDSWTRAHAWLRGRNLDDGFLGMELDDAQSITARDANSGW